MLAAATTRIGTAVGVTTVLRELGLDPNQVIAEAGLAPILFDDPDNIIPFAALGHLAAFCVARAKCPHFGLLVGQRGSLASLGRVGFIAQNSPDVGSALTSLATYMHDHNRGAAVTLAVKGDLTALGYAIYQAVEGADQIADAAMAVALQIMRALCGDGWSPSAVTFARHKPPDPAPYQRFFRSKLQFDADETALLFETRWLNRRLANAEPELRRLLLKEAEQTQTVRRSDLPDDVRRVIRTMVGTAHCSTRGVAHLFGINERTLHRQLMAQGTSFKALADEMRYEIARQLLRDTSIPLGKIAQLLDYSEISAFNRAFVRWSGLPPGAWRKRNA